MKRVRAMGRNGSPCSYDASVKMPAVTAYVELTRWRDWAHSKLPFAGAAALLFGVSPLHTLLVLATVALWAAFGYGVNQVADVLPDARAGKRNGADALSSGARLAFVGGTAAAALGSSVLWARGPAAPGLLGAGLVLALAYSARPVRLKERGVAGVASAAIAQWTLPVVAIATAAPNGLDARAALIAALSAALGVRWMLIHQLHDAAADRRAGVQTFATENRSAPRLLDGVFAVELAAVIGLLAVSWPTSTAPAAALAAWICVGEVAQPLRARLRAYDAAPLAAYYFALLRSPALVGSLRAVIARPRAAAARA